jgi:S-adenosylmethionine:tRNA ribosyltransferase-isomerase
MRTDLFDFVLPPERIALRPARPRDAARLLAVGPESLGDHGVLDLPRLLAPGDLLVFNDTRVIPAQLEGRRGERRSGRRSTSARGCGAGGRSCAMRGGSRTVTGSTSARG